MNYNELDSVEKSRLLHVIVDAVDKTFGYAEWIELASRTNTSVHVERHPRLLRSLGFGDEDYRGHVLKVIRYILEADPANLHTIVQFGSINETIKKEHPSFGLETLTTTGTPFFNPDAGELYRNVIQALGDARKHVAEGQAASAVDRIYTVMHGYLRRKAEEHGLITDPRVKEQAPALLNTLLDHHPAFAGDGHLSAEIKTVKRSLRTIGEALRTVRNRSLAHPEDFVLGDVEALLFIDTMNTLLRYIHGAIAEWNSARSDEEDASPF